MGFAPYTAYGGERNLIVSNIHPSLSLPNRPHLPTCLLYIPPSRLQVPATKGTPMRLMN